MALSKPALPDGLMYLSRSVLSASGEPVKSPVLIAPGVFSRVLARAAPAASHAGWLVSWSAQAHAASLFLAPAGMTNDVPDATANGLPSASLNGTAPMSTLSTNGVSTLTYHWALTSA